MPPNNPMTEGEALAVDVRQELDRKFLDVWQDSTDYYAMSKAGAKFIWDSAVRAVLSAASEGAAIAPEEVHVRIAGRYVLCDLQETTFDDLALYHARESAALTAHTAASGGDAVAWVCLRGDTYAHGQITELQVQHAEGVEFPIGTRLYTAPPAAVPADALAHACDRVDRVIQYASDTLSGPEEPMSDRAGWYRGGVVEILRRVRAVKAELADIAAMISKGADHEQR